MAARAIVDLCRSQNQIEQKVSLERQAFDAKLNIRNGLDGVQIEQIDVNLVFKNQNGIESSGQFASILSSSDGVTGSVEDGSGRNVSTLSQHLA